MATGYESELLANEIFENLVGEKNANLPDIDLTQSLFDIPWDLNHAVYNKVDRIHLEELTTKEVGGTGAFDTMMASFRAHLKEEHEAGRITGPEYTKTYIALTTSAMENAVRFLLERDTTFWMAARAQAEAINARVANETAKLQAMLGRAEYALTKMKLAGEDATFGAQQYQIENILPAQVALSKEQMEAQRAQTMDIRSDEETEVTGVLGMQKALYSQQIESYQEDVKHKNTKMILDTWIARKTIDESIAPPHYLLTRSLENILYEARKSATGGAPVPPGHNAYGPPPENYNYTDDPKTET